MSTNQPYYDDHLPILREHIPSESVDLVYLDPPFNCNRNYNVLFWNESGTESEAQIHTFEDTWHWTIDGTERTCRPARRSPTARHGPVASSGPQSPRRQAGLSGVGNGGVTPV
jgi:hypothetical protein